MTDRSNVCTIPPGVAFLDTLVASLLNGDLIPGFDAAADPFALNAVTIYLPTRRAVRTIRESFLNRLGPAVLLPQIRPIGDIDEDGLVLDTVFASDIQDRVPPSVDVSERQLFLTQLILRWSNVMERRKAGLNDEAQLVPASPADAARLAALLADLIDAVATGEADWSMLDRIVPEDLAGYWEITLQFLRIATEYWPRHLEQRGLCDPGTRRDTLIRMEAERLAQSGSAGPIIAAGSTGSVPATAKLLAAVAQLPNGAVILPGLDLDLDNDTWGMIATGFLDPVLAGHPQFGLARLLAVLGIDRHDVRPLASPAPALSARNQLVSQAMRPAATTDLWSSDEGLGARPAAALKDIGLVEAGNEREEALSIAIILRQCLERDDHVAALVTPDRGLARRVIGELERWNIRVDDSAGKPLPATNVGILSRLTARAAINGSAENLLALLMHPDVLLGLEASDVRRSARSLERAVLRGPRLKPGLDGLQIALNRNRQRAFADEPGERQDRLSQAASGLSEEAWQEAIAIAAHLESALHPLAELARSDTVHPLAVLLDAHWRCLQTLCAPAGESSGFPVSDEAGESLLRRFAELVASAEYGPELTAANYPEFFDAILGGTPVRPAGADPRVHVWGALEARLQNVDTIVLAGLNEGTWPLKVKLDPFLSRNMRQTLELEAPERRTGLAAHDFTQALGHERVWLTRADRQDGEPKVASRWLQRLAAFAGKDGTGVMRRRGDAILALARQLVLSTQPKSEAYRPCPVPALSLRPRRLPVTAIETLIRDPYAVYARYILKLKMFEPIARQPGAAERGSLFHAVLERFVSERPSGPFDDRALQDLIEHGRKYFREFQQYPEVGALWWPRFKAAAKWFVEEEAERDSVIRRRTTEVSGNIDITADFGLTVRADRIDILNHGGLSIIDYKTGAPPGVDEVLSLAPQLLLEALIAEAGGFVDIPEAEVSELVYYHLKGSGDGGNAAYRGFREAVRGKQAVTLSEAKELTRQRIKALARHFAAPDNGYLSRKIPQRQTQWQGDYDHLARVAEWSIGADE